MGLTRLTFDRDKPMNLVFGLLLWTVDDSGLPTGPITIPKTLQTPGKLKKGNSRLTGYGTETYTCQTKSSSRLANTGKDSVYSLPLTAVSY